MQKRPAAPFKVGDTVKSGYPGIITVVVKSLFYEDGVWYFRYDLPKHRDVIALCSSFKTSAQRQDDISTFDFN